MRSLPTVCGTLPDTGNSPWVTTALWARLRPLLLGLFSCWSAAGLVGLDSSGFTRFPTGGPSFALPF